MIKITFFWKEMLRSSLLGYLTSLQQHCGANSQEIQFRVVSNSFIASLASKFTEKDKSEFFFNSPMKNSIILSFIA